MAYTADNYITANNDNDATHCIWKLWHPREHVRKIMEQELSYTMWVVILDVPVDCTHVGYATIKSVHTAVNSLKYHQLRYRWGYTCLNLMSILAFKTIQ